MKDKLLFLFRELIGALTGSKYEVIEEEEHTIEPYKKIQRYRRYGVCTWCGANTPDHLSLECKKCGRLMREVWVQDYES